MGEETSNEANRTSLDQVTRRVPIWPDLELGLQEVVLGLAAGGTAAVTHWAMILRQRAIWGPLPDTRWVILLVMLAGGIPSTWARQRPQ